MLHALFQGHLGRGSGGRPCACNTRLMTRGGGGGGDGVGDAQQFMTIRRDNFSLMATRRNVSKTRYGYSGFSKLEGFVCRRVFKKLKGVLVYHLAESVLDILTPVFAFLLDGMFFALLWLSYGPYDCSFDPSEGYYPPAYCFNTPKNAVHYSFLHYYEDYPIKNCKPSIINHALFHLCIQKSSNDQLVYDNKYDYYYLVYKFWGNEKADNCFKEYLHTIIDGHIVTLNRSVRCYISVKTYGTFFQGESNKLHKCYAHVN